MQYDSVYPMTGVPHPARNPFLSAPQLPSRELFADLCFAVIFCLLSVNKLTMLNWTRKYVSTLL